MSNVKLGDVSFRSFDDGVYRTLQGQLINGRYFLPLSFAPGVVPPLFSEYTADESLIGTQMPGIPFIYGNPAAAVMRYLIPCIRVKREDPSPALERSHSKHVKYRAPADGEELITVNYRGRTATGYARHEQQEASIPEDIPYTITVEAAGKSARANAHILMDHCMSILYPHEKLYVVDSLGRGRHYQVYCEGPSELTSIADIRDRTVAFALSVRVQANIDVRPATEEQAATQVVVNLSPMSQLPE